MYTATKIYQKQILVWLIWVIAIVMAFMPRAPQAGLDNHQPALAGVVQYDEPLPLCRYRLRLIIRRRKRTLRGFCQRISWATQLLDQLRHGTLTMAQVVEALTRRQVRRQVGALPVLTALLAVLQVREIINHHCPTHREVDHGAVALVLILNRLVAPRPLYRIVDWMSHTILATTLGVPVSKFNDDRLGRTLDALAQHGQAIWHDIVHRALVQADIDLSVLFYDLSAFVTHGAYTESAYVDFGFAHNTPSDKRKFKVGLNVTADGNFPFVFQLWPGRTADMATVQANMENLRQVLARYGRSVAETLLIGDRATLNAELALTYYDKGIRYLSGLQARKKEHRELLLAASEAQIRTLTLKDARGAHGYWGWPCQVPFEYEGRRIVEQGLLVLSGPMQRAVRRDRAAKLRALHQDLQAIRAKVGRPRYRTVKCVQQRANTVLKHSPVGKLMYAEAYQDAQGQVGLRWHIDRGALLLAMRQDGRYLLVTNDTTLSYVEMFNLYLAKDGVEKRFRVSKSDLNVSPIYLHKDTRIAGMLLINMIALLAYSVVERQVQQAGWHITTRQIILKLACLDLIETWCWDDSVVYRVVPLDQEQTLLLEVLARVLADLQRPRWSHSVLPSGTPLPLALPPPPGKCSPALAG